MEAIRAEVVQDLVTSKPDKLKSIASKHRLNPSLARSIRKHWFLLLTGRCVDCKSRMTDGKCPRGHEKPEDNQALELLQQLEPSSPLIVNNCMTCKKEFTHTVEYALRMTKRYGALQPSRYCRDCKDSQQMERVKKMTLVAKPKSEATQKKAKTKTKKRAPVDDKEPLGLTHRPFEALGDVELKN